MLLAEDLLLVVTDDESGKLSVDGSHVDIALGGALMVELALLGKVDLTGDEDPGLEQDRIVVRDPAPVGEPELDRALRVLADQEGRKPGSAISPLGKGLRTRLYERLVEKGILGQEKGTILGIFRTTRWPAADAQHEETVVRYVGYALVQGTTPDDRTAALISLLHALRIAHKVVDPQEHGVSKKHVTARAKEIADGDWGSRAVRRAIDEMMAAITAATTAASVAATTATG